MKRVRVPLVSTAVLFIIAALLFYMVFPTHTWLSQKNAESSAETRLANLEAENESLRGRIERYKTDEGIEELARRDHILAYPGQEVYILLPQASEGDYAWPSIEFE